jgi:tetratricopeptide (TPR) repeat protein
MLQFFTSPNSKVRPLIVVLALLAVASCSRSPEERAQRHYEQGEKLLAQNDPVKAAIEFKNALQFNAGHVAAWRGLAQIEERNKNWRGLVPVLRKVVELDPKDVDAKLRLAKLLLLGNALDDALNLANAAVQLDERNTTALALKAAILVKQNNEAGAVLEAEKALAIDPANAEALIVLAATKMARRDDKGALEALYRAAPGEKPNVGIELFKIQVHERLGELKKVEELLRNLIEAYPQEIVFRRQLVALYISDKRLDDAEKELRAIAASDPTNVNFGLTVVRFLSAYKSPDAARQELLLRISAGGQGGQAFQYQMALAEFDIARGNVSDSVALLEKLIRGGETPENVLLAQNKLAELHFLTKKHDEAERLVSEILRKDSRNIRGLKLRATIRMERGELESAINDLRQALNDQPRATDVMLLLALAYERNGAIELAEKQYAEATRASGFDARLGLNYAAFLQRRGSAARADDILTELAGRWPNNIQVLAALANSKLQNRDWSGAEEVSNTIRRLGNTQAIADQIFGEVLSQRSSHEESIEVLQGAYTRAAASVPNSAQPMVALVRAYARANQPERAVSFLQDVLKKNPDNAEALVLLGSVQMLTKAPDQAEASFKAAIERQPKSATGYRALANFHIQQRNLPEALKVLRAGLKEQPKSATLRMSLAGALEMNGEYDAAIGEYETMLEDQPSSMIIANNLASLLTDHRSDAASLDRASSLIGSLQKSPIPQFKDTIGWVRYRRGEYKASTALLEQAVAELPNVAMIRYHLGMSYLALGDTAKAREQFEHANRLGVNDKGLREKVSAAMKQAGLL